MATYVNDLRLKEIATGDESGTWGTSTNTNLELVAEAFSFGTEAITTNADTHTTTIADGATDPGRSIYLQYTGTLDSTCTITIGPNTVSKLWFIENATSGSQDIIIKQGSGATVTVPNGNVKAIYSDGAGSGGKMVDAFTDLHVGGSFFVTTSDQDEGITVECTNGGASAGPSLKLDRNSGSPADSDGIGEIEFSGRNDASETIQYARIAAAIIDASDGTEDGLLEIDSIVNGTNRSRIQITSTETVFNEDSQDLDFRVESDSNTHRLFLDAGNDRIVMGHTAGISTGGVSGAFQQIGNTSTTRSTHFTNFSADANSSAIRFAKSRGSSIGSNTVVQSGDNLGIIVFSGDDGSDLASKSADILAEVDGTPGSNDMPGRLVFRTTADGSDAVSEAMRITDAGSILINTTTDFGGKVNIARADNNTTLALVCTDNDASDGPILDFIRDSASPSTTDDIAVINFKADDSDGNRDTYAQIEVFSPGVTSGSEQGRLVINTNDGSAGLQNRIDCTTGETVFNNASADLDFRIETDGAANKFFVDGGNNVVVIGNNAPVSSVSVDPTFQIQGNTNANAGMSINRFTNNDSGPYINFSKSRSTSVGDNFTVVQDGDTIGRIGFIAADGNDFAHQAAKISAAIDGTPGSNDIPGRLEFYTTADGANSPSEAMRIDSSGNVGIGKVPEATNSGYNSLDVGLANLMARTSNTDFYLSSNSYFSNAWRYTTSAAAGQYYQSGGTHVWQRATESTTADGTVNNTGNWDESMRLDASGNLLQGITTIPTGVQSSRQLISSNATGAEIIAYREDSTIAANDFVGAFLIGHDDNSGTEDHFIGMWGQAASANGNMNLKFAAGRDRYEAGTSDMTISSLGNVSITNALSKGSGSFRIDHPLPAKTDTHHLVHSFVEGPQADLIYRGKVTLVGGSATVNVDTAAGMTEGTFEVLCTDVQCFTSNESGWTAVKGSVSGNTLTITAQDNTCTDTISWMVVGERKDQHMIDTNWTDENGKVIVEPLKENN